jgi:hypothetical protein
LADAVFETIRFVAKRRSLLSRKREDMTKYFFLPSLASLLFACPLLGQEKHHHTEPLEKPAMYALETRQWKEALAL